MDGGNDQVEGGGDGSSFANIFGGTDDPLELLWDGGGGGGTTGQPEVVVSCSLRPCPAAILESGLPPSEEVMAAWLYEIVCAKECIGADDSLKVPPAMPMPMGTTLTRESSKGKLPATDVMFGATLDTNSSEKKNASSSRKGSAAHNTAEKRRRCRIAERLRTLQQLVPGCDHKSSQARTLDQTIQYMRSLQQQVQSMSTSWQASAYPIAQSPPAATLAITMPPAATFWTGVVPFGAMLPYPHYQAPMVPAAASAALLYIPAQAGAAPNATAGDHAQCSVSTEQQ